MPDLSRRVTKVREHELEVVRNQLRRNGVTVLEGSARFTGPKALSVETPEASRTIKAENVLIACGSRPARHPDIPCDGKCIFDSDQLIALDVEMPRSAIVVGAGVIGLEYASMLTALNIKTTVVDQRPTLLDFVDREIIDALTYHMRVRKTIFRLGAPRWPCSGAPRTPRSCRCPMASTRSPRSPWSAAPSRSSPPARSGTRWASRGTRSWRSRRSSATIRACSSWSSIPTR